MSTVRAFDQDEGDIHTMMRFFRRAAPPPSEPDTSGPAAAPASVEASLSSTRKGFFGAVRGLFQTQRSLDDAFWDELEERLIQADVGAHTTGDLIEELQSQHARRPFQDPRAAELALRGELLKLLKTTGDTGLFLPDVKEGIAIILVIGVNGVGKTTSIAKLTHYFQGGGRHPILIAGDTFRAAAIDQLKIWGDRTAVTVIAQAPGSDPASVVFDGIGAAVGRGADTVLIDTAGRLHTKINLMEELKKVRRVVERRHPGAPHETLLVLDAITGQNGLMQAKSFAHAVGVTGLILSKLDSSAKGGVVFAIAQELKLPIKFIGTGERLEDLSPFDPDEFVHALFA